MKMISTDYEWFELYDQIVDDLFAEIEEDQREEDEN